MRSGQLFPSRVVPSRPSRVLVSRAASVAISIVCVWVWLWAFPGVLRAQTAPDVQLNVIERTLKNGMRVLMVERHDSPTVALYLLFKVGGVDDPQGKTGIAHMLEHMMFKGTQSYGTSNFKAEGPLMGKIDGLYA
ncbi:MAG: insulinase family protein, partial [Terriglobia bacterium]